MGGEGRCSGRPHDARIVARGADKEDRAAAYKIRKARAGESRETILATVN